MRHITLNPSGELAQLVVRLLCKQEVRSSSLLFSMELRFLLIPYSSTAEQRAVNSKVPRSNRGGGVEVLGLQITQTSVKVAR